MQPTLTPPDRNRPTRAEAEEAVRTLIRWAGDDPGREGLRDTPARVVRAYEEWFSGYRDDPGALLQRTFEEVGGYDEIVVLRDIAFRVIGWSDFRSWSTLSRSAFRCRSGSQRKSPIRSRPCCSLTVSAWSFKPRTSA